MWMWVQSPTLCDVPNSSYEPSTRCFVMPDWCIIPIPIASMYGIYTYIWLIFMVNVGKYTIHGSYGIWDLQYNNDSMKNRFRNLHHSLAFPCSMLVYNTPGNMPKTPFSWGMGFSVKVGVLSVTGTTPTSAHQKVWLTKGMWSFYPQIWEDGSNLTCTNITWAAPPKTTTLIYLHICIFMKNNVIYIYNIYYIDL